MGHFSVLRLREWSGLTSVDGVIELISVFAVITAAAYCYQINNDYCRAYCEGLGFCL